jgi:hypothetical protein
MRSACTRSCGVSQPNDWSTFRHRIRAAMATSAFSMTGWRSCGWKGRGDSGDRQLPVDIAKRERGGAAAPVAGVGESPPSPRRRGRLCCRNPAQASRPAGGSPSEAIGIANAAHGFNSQLQHLQSMVRLRSARMMRPVCVPNHSDGRRPDRAQQADEGIMKH